MKTIKKIKLLFYFCFFFNINSKLKVNLEFIKISRGIKVILSCTFYVQKLTDVVDCIKLKVKEVNQDSELMLI
jgi:hypothetical protein